MTTTPPATPTRSYVLYLAEVTEASAANLIGAVISQRDQGSTEVCICLATVGGRVISGFAIYNALRGLGVRLVTHNIGSVNSIGNVIFLAGDERFATTHSTFMFHGVSTQLTGGTMDGRQTRELLGNLTADEARISAVIAERTNLSQDRAEEFFRDAVTMDAEAALDVGIVDAIAPIDIPTGARVNWIG